MSIDSFLVRVMAAHWAELLGVAYQERVTCYHMAEVAGAAVSWQCGQR